jgi:GAF domain-containing protein
MVDRTADGHGRSVNSAPAGIAAHDLVPLLIDYLDDVSIRAADRLGRVGGVAVTLGSTDGPTTVGASSALAVEVDLLQYSIGVGPCLHALRSGVGLYVTDLAADARWGEYGPRAAAMGAACCISVPVILNQGPVAVLKVYATEVDGLTADQQQLARQIAVEITGGVGLAAKLAQQAKELDDRSAAMNTRRTIDLALGILMERTGCGLEEAFALLRRYSQQYNVKLKDAARQVVAAQAGSAEDIDHAPFRTPVA